MPVSETSDLSQYLLQPAAAPNNDQGKMTATNEKSKKSKKDKKEKKSKKDKKEKKEKKHKRTASEVENISEPPKAKKIQIVNENAIPAINEPTTSASYTEEHPKPVIVKHAKDETVEEFRKKSEIRIENSNGKTVPDPVRDFNVWDDKIRSAIDKQGFTAPSAIQSQCWPILLEGHDAVAIAKTGSGKTCGFILPAIKYIRDVRPKGKYGDSPVALVLAPTRELACQIETEANKYCLLQGIRVRCVYGGVPRREQIQGCRAGIDILVATPGRLLDFAEFRQVVLDHVSFFVLDEADRMLDMGFEADMRKIVELLPKKHQTVLFSATWPKEVRKLANEFTEKPLEMHIGNTSNELVASKNITQRVILLNSQDEKENRLFQLLDEENADNTGVSCKKAIVFVKTKRDCDRLGRKLRQSKWKAQALHGDMEQPDRDWVLANFRTGAVRVICATDVAARGLDVADIKIVINYDLPTNLEDYIHRIGRTGRANNKGDAISFFVESNDRKNAPELVKIMQKADQKVSPELEELANRNRKRGGRGGARGGARGGRYGGGGGNRYGGGRGRGRFGGGSGGGRGRGFGR